MNIFIWVVQVLVALLFLMSGFFKGFIPIEQMASQGAIWVTTVPAWMVKAAAATDILGGLGLLLPSILRIRPRLTIIAAWCLILQMVLAVVVHLRAGDIQVIGMNVFLIVGTAFIIWGRTKKAPIAPRGA
ncbi:DoxX family protein [bacterium]|nr:DoxX family protein [bacterium]